MHRKNAANEPQQRLQLRRTVAGNPRQSAPKLLAEKTFLEQNRAHYNVDWIGWESACHKGTTALSMSRTSVHIRSRVESSWFSNVQPIHLILVSGCHNNRTIVTSAHSNCLWLRSLIKGRLSLLMRSDRTVSNGRLHVTDLQKITIGYIRLLYLGGIDGWSAGISWHAQTCFPSNDCNTGHTGKG